MLKKYKRIILHTVFIGMFIFGETAYALDNGAVKEGSAANLEGGDPGIYLEQIPQEQLDDAIRQNKRFYKKTVDNQEVVMLPLRACLEDMGQQLDIQYQISWLAETKAVLLQVEDAEFNIVIGQAVYTKNGERLVLDTAAELYFEMAFLPASFYETYFNLDIELVDEHTLILSSK